MTRAILLLPLATGCLTLDSFVHAGIPCGEVSAETCEGQADVWDQVCATCADDYDWGRVYEWEPGTIEPGETVSPVDPAVVVHQDLPTDDGEGTLDVYFLPSRGGVPALAQTTVLYQHGNWAGIEPYVPRIQMLWSAGYNVLVWDYRGYGKSQPAEYPTPDQFLADARQIRAFADTVAPDPEKIVVYGYSLGAIPSVEIATQAPGCALVLEAPFTSMRTIAASNSGATMGEQFFSEGSFDNVGKIASYHGPLLAMTGTADLKFPVADVTELYDAAPGDKQLWVVDGAAHGVGQGIPESGVGTYLDTMATFLQELAPTCLSE